MKISDNEGWAFENAIKHYWKEFEEQKKRDSGHSGAAAANVGGHSGAAAANGDPDVEEDDE